MSTNLKKQSESYKEGFELGYEMASQKQHLKEILTTAYQKKGYAFGYDNSGIKQDTNFKEFIDGVVSGHTKYDIDNPSQYYDLESEKSHFVSLFGVIGVVLAMVPIYLFSPENTGLGILLGLMIGVPVIFVAMKLTKKAKGL